MTPSIFLPLHEAFFRPHLEYAIQTLSPILSRDCQVLESVHKLAVKFLIGLQLAGQLMRAVNSQPVTH